jgi:hypothetical protein
MQSTNNQIPRLPKHMGYKLAGTQIPMDEELWEFGACPPA